METKTKASRKERLLEPRRWEKWGAPSGLTGRIVAEPSREPSHEKLAKSQADIITTSTTIKTKQIVGSPKLIALGLLQSLVGLVYICAKQSSRAKRKLRAASTKRLMNKKAQRDDEDDPPLWQRMILMGNKCQTFDFSSLN
ncbi:hypothetical protein Droror1_Dr00018996 [Drosera rotundifolia]